MKRLRLRLRLLLGVAGAAAAGCTAPSAAGDTTVVVSERQFFPQCPLAVAQPSITLVSSAAAWQQMLSVARSSPPPFVAAATSFDKQSVLVAATPTTSSPIVQLGVKNNTVRLNMAEQVLRVDLDVTSKPPPPGEMGVTVVGEPCLVMWTARLPSVKTLLLVDGRSGAVLAKTQLP
jgi:hypothetical protein